ncbi:MAG: hypothetical protein A2161_06730 [Candidatus Schekmanbacteria bacterium RBG_13_48_7]|uniref:Alginate export domain-containing protein n=1 Tax=Candidatus Schekmanbacteria bacterium RBG_13_48_7 TaxID=1817878 RepID=A0A1F7RKZ4_9BACT|nr:MAG: hypothetical protein A2161_06730 [Candidatus Schekmanbacteria bacterium RBG_13_48_7]
MQLADKIFLDAYFRPRIEFDNLDFNNKTGIDSYSTFRTRLGIAMEDIVPKTNLYIMFGDSRMMGFSDPYLTGKPIGPNKWDDNVGVIEAFMEVLDLIKPGTMFKVGRMTNDQGRARIFGPGNWNVYGPRTYDGIKIGYSNEDFALHFWSLFGQAGDRHWYFDSDTPGVYPDKSIAYKKDHTLAGTDISLWSNMLNFLAFLDLDQNPVEDSVHGGHNPAFSRITIAANFGWKTRDKEQFSVDLDTAYQFGSQAYDGGEGDISAYLVAGELKYRLEPKLSSFIGAGFDIISGDDGSSSDKISNFYEYYYSRHRFQGHMDYFKNPSGIKSKGLQDFIFRAGFSPHKKLVFQLDLHHFQTEKSFESAENGGSSHILGKELDTTLDYKIRKGLTAQFGYDIFWPTEDWQGSDSDASTFCYMSITASF